MSPHRRPLAVATMCALLLSACGIGADDTPRDIPAQNQLSLDGDSDTQAGAATGTARVYLLAPEAQKHIGAMMWFSDSFQQEVGLNQRCLEGRKAEPYSHDNLFHSLLGVLGVHTSVYNKQLDMFAPCRQSS